MNNKATHLGLSCVPQCKGFPQIFKQSQTNGGSHITFQEGKFAEHTICETYLPGIAISHLFLATNGQIKTVGISTQWHSVHDTQHPFSYGGCINQSSLTDVEREHIEEWSLALSVDLELQGLNNVDYLWCGKEIYFLELNPRPSASMSLYDSNHSNTLFNAHIHACQGQIVYSASQPKSKAQAIIYAQDNFVLGEDFEWGAAICDRPLVHRFRTGEPICSIIAQSDNAASTLSLLQYHIRNLLNRIKREREVCQALASIV